MYGPETGGGGLGRYVEQLVNELQVSDLKNRYVLFLKKENFDACKIVNPNFEKRLANVHWYGVDEQLNMGGIIDRENLDLVHFPHWNVPLFLRTPFVVTIHDLILLDEPFSSKISTRHKAIFALKYWVYKLVLSHAILRAKKVIAVSYATANSVKKHFQNVDPKKIEVVYEGVTSLPVSSIHVSESSVPYLLYVGNAYPHKNLPKLIEAFQLLHDQHPDLKLILAGRESVFYKELMTFAESRAGSGDPTHNFVEFVLNPSDDGLS